MLGDFARAAGYRLIIRDEVGSTMEEARRALHQGDPGLLWIVARSQNAGRGRHGRHWTSPPGNLYASLLLVNPCEPALAPQLGFVAGLALHDAAARVTGLTAPRLALKWPNDLLVYGAKCSGLLLEGESGAGRFAVIAGLGINIASCAQGTPYPASFLRAHAPDVTIEAVLEEAGASLAGVVRAQYFVTDRAYCEPVLAVCGEVFREVRPAAGIYVVTGLLKPEMKVEIEVTARLARP